MELRSVDSLGMKHNCLHYTLSPSSTVDLGRFIPATQHQLIWTQDEVRLVSTNMSKDMGPSALFLRIMRKKELALSPMHRTIRRVGNHLPSIHMTEI
jgi:hypothetical protein